MALDTTRKDQHTPCLARTVTTAGAQIVLADATSSPLATNPQGVNHLPAAVWVSTTVTGNLVVLDANGTSNTIPTVAPAAATPGIPFLLPFTIKSIEATTTAGYVITACWNPEP